MECICWSLTLLKATVLFLSRLRYWFLVYFQWFLRRHRKHIACVKMVWFHLVIKSVCSVSFTWIYQNVLLSNFKKQLFQRPKSLGILRMTFRRRQNTFYRCSLPLVWKSALALFGFPPRGSVTDFSVAGSKTFWFWYCAQTMVACCQVLPANSFSQRQGPSMLARWCWHCTGKCWKVGLLCFLVACYILAIALFNSSDFSCIFMLQVVTLKKKPQYSLIGCECCWHFLNGTNSSTVMRS